MQALFVFLQLLDGLLPIIIWIYKTIKRLIYGQEIAQEVQQQQNKQNVDRNITVTNRTAQLSQKSTKLQNITQQIASKIPIARNTTSKPNYSLFQNLLFALGYVTIQQGHIGIYKTLGVYNSSIMNPGMHYLYPFINTVDEIQVSVKTDVIQNVSCRTSSGALIMFQKVEIVHQLKKQLAYNTIKNYGLNYVETFIKDKLQHKINQICSKNTLQEIYITKFDRLDQKLVKFLQKDNARLAPGIQIISMRFTKPLIPKSIRQNYEIVQKTKAQFLILEQKRKILIQNEETRHKEALSKMNSEYEVKLINLQQQLFSKENQLKIQEIEAIIYLQREKAKIDAEYLFIYEEMMAAKQLFTKPYLKFLGYESFNQNITLHLGDSVPKIQI